MYHRMEVDDDRHRKWLKGHRGFDLYGRHEIAAFYQF